MQLYKYFSIKKIIYLLFICVILFSGCTNSDSNLLSNNIQKQEYSYKDKEIIKNEVLKIISSRNLVEFSLESEDYNKKNNEYTIYAISQDRNKKVKVVVKEAEIKNGKLISFVGPISYWNGSEYVEN